MLSFLLMTDNSSDTKKKILDVARVLFAEQGFEGTSVREIAKQAEVNIASLNYHFTNKENLFQEILKVSYIECSKEIRDFYEKEHPKLEDILVHVFRFFTYKSHDLITFFKMMMSTQHSDKMACHGGQSEDERFGPPGGTVIIEAIQKELGSTLAEADQHFAVKILFSHVVHMSLMSKCWFKKNNIPYTSEADIENNIRRLCRMVIQDLKK